MAKEVVETLRKQLFSDQESLVYAVLDGASIPELPEMLAEHDPLRVCLFRGVYDPELEATAPYLVQLPFASPLTDWILGEGWGKHWGIFAIAHENVPFIELRKHFRDLLRVRLPDGKAVIFRFYDPRVFTSYISTCTTAELRQIFGPVEQYVAEKKGKKEPKFEAITYCLTAGKLKEESLPIINK